MYPPSKDKSLLKHTSYSRPPTFKENIPKCRKRKSPPTVYETPTKHINYTGPPTCNENTPNYRKRKSPPTIYESPAKLSPSTQSESEVSSTATTYPEMFWDCPVFLTQLSQPRDTRDSPGLSQVLVRENTHIPQYLVSQDTQDVLGVPRTVPGSPTRNGVLWILR